MPMSRMPTDERLQQWEEKHGFAGIFCTSGRDINRKCACGKRTTSLATPFCRSCATCAHSLSEDGVQEDVPEPRAKPRRPPPDRSQSVHALPHRGLRPHRQAPGHALPHVLGCDQPRGARVPGLPEGAPLRQPTMGRVLQLHAQREARGQPPVARVRRKHGDRMQRACKRRRASKPRGGGQPAPGGAGRGGSRLGVCGCWRAERLHVMTKPFRYPLVLFLRHAMPPKPWSSIGRPRWPPRRP